MNISFFDQLLTFVMVVLMPIMGVLEFKALKRKVAAGVPNARLKMYLIGIAFQWALVAGLFIIWSSQGRTVADLGLKFDGSARAWIGMGIAVAISIAAVLQSAHVMKSETSLAALAGAFRDLEALLPHTQSESRGFAALSITAGVCEELLYRGFLMMFVLSISNIWVAVAATSVVFSLGHLYQGPKGILKTGMAGLAMAGLYVLSDSLFPPMLLHALIDLNSGYLGRKFADAERFNNVTQATS